MAGEGRGGRTATRRCSNKVAGGGEVGDAAVDSRRTRLDSSHQEGEDVDTEQMEPTASSGVACINGDDDCEHPGPMPCAGR